jgi:formamidopyrimidine-DNA glycosylase
MPELPEAEVVARQLQRALPGARVKDCWIGRPDIVRVGLDTLDWYRGAHIRTVERRGKSIVLGLMRGMETRYFLAELGMTGLLLFQSPNQSYQKHTHVILTLEAASTDLPAAELRYWNPRRFGRVYLLDEDALTRFCTRRFGCDPLQVTAEEFLSLVKTRRARVKALFLHQQRIAGIGNIYANEILHRARVHPHAIGSRLSRQTILRLHASMRDVLTKAIQSGGSTIRDFLAPDGTPGRFQTLHRVYDKAGAPCPTGCGGTIRRMVTERSSFYCPRCQHR